MANPPFAPPMTRDMWGAACKRPLTICEMWCRRARYTMDTLGDPATAYAIIRDEILRMPTPRIKADVYDACVSRVIDYDSGGVPPDRRDAALRRMIDDMITICAAGGWM